jgi:hypothetical protein
MILGFVGCKISLLLCDGNLLSGGVTMLPVGRLTDGRWDITRSNGSFEVFLHYGVFSFQFKNEPAVRIHESR